MAGSKVQHLVTRIRSRHLGGRPSDWRSDRRVLLPGLVAFLVIVALLDFPFVHAQTRRPRTQGAHSKPAIEFSAANRSLVEHAITFACSERVRDPFGSVPIDEMQSRPSMPLGHPDAVAGARRAQRLLPEARTLVATALIQLAHEYRVYQSPRDQLRIKSASARIQRVTRVKPDMEARDNASVFLRDPRTIHFGTIFLASLRSDEAMISVLAHELTHIADGRADGLHVMFRAIGRRAASRTGQRIEGQRAEELACDLVGALAARAFVQQTPSWEPLGRRLARSLEHNCVTEDEGDEEHLSPRNTIRALFSLDLSFASTLLSDRP
ncbi:MAG: hypothetical protein QOE77_2470 [Blastocatellia bacterium]|nr:hypothetical protein [Blastocatellia bacterium]